MLILEEHLLRQMAFSRATFGPGERTEGVCAHIREELDEIAECGNATARMLEWVDVVLLGLDGMWRANFAANRERLGDVGEKMILEATAHDVVNQILIKQSRNELRDWPDWRTADPNKPINHDRSKDT